MAVSLVPVDDSNLDLAFVDADGAPIALGVQSRGGNLIRGFTLPADGTYFIQVSGQPQTAYQLVVTRNSDLEVLANESARTATPLTSYDSVLGAIGGTRKLNDDPPDDSTTIGFPPTLLDGEGFPWDLVSHRRLVSLQRHQTAPW